MRIHGGRPLLEREEHHPMHPQAVPRGFLRLYTVSLLSKKPSTGYAIMQSIEETTGGTWRPGPGTIYPLLKSLTEEGLIAVKGVGKREDSVEYEITGRGKAAVSGIQRVMALVCKREGAMNHLFTDLLAPEIVAPMMINRTRDVFDDFHEVIGRVEPAESARLLRELRLALELELGRIETMETTNKKPRRHESVPILK